MFISLVKNDMAGSIVFAHLEFLKELGEEIDDRVRYLRIQTINTETMRALCKIITCILNNSIPTLSYDQRVFQSNRNVLRHLISSNIFLVRKKRTLERYNELIPRFLRMHYIINTCIFELRQSLGLVL